MSNSVSINNVAVYDPDAGKYSDPTKQTSAELQADFFKMLTAQLENQDPLEPMKDQDFTAQMAQFSALSEQQKGNELLEKLIASQGVGALNEAVSYIGRNVVSEGNGLEIANGSGEILFSSDKDTMAVVNVFDTDGALVRSLDAAHYQTGDNEVNINDPKYGDPLVDGSYTFSVTVMSNGDDPAKITKLQNGTVKGVSNGENGVQLDVGGRTLNLSQVLRVELAGGG
ncbi:MAG: hypothetical protein HQL50_06855 [Magnetococcales bacterium]|nr:hypothetical protein [Magnetococcales bacterium]